MLSCLHVLRQPDLLGMSVRVLLALVCGGLIGIERSGKRRPAGFRTHILICLGATMTLNPGQGLEDLLPASPPPGLEGQNGTGVVLPFPGDLQVVKNGLFYQN